MKFTNFSGTQAGSGPDARFPDGIAPVHSDILLARLRPGQEIELEARLLSDRRSQPRFR